jgi:predicted phosphodiesterase
MSSRVNAETTSSGAENTLRVALLSDTHALLRPQARAFAVGCDYIIHGGDIGSADILEELGEIAPLIAVRGNKPCEAITTANSGLRTCRRRR